MAGKFSSTRTQQPKQEATTPALNHEQAKLQAWLRQVKFRKTIFGGVSEADVWKKIGELNTLYEAALSAERARYDALLEAQKSGGDDYESTKTPD